MFNLRQLRIGPEQQHFGAVVPATIGRQRPINLEKTLQVLSDELKWALQCALSQGLLSRQVLQQLAGNGDLMKYARDSAFIPALTLCCESRTHSDPSNLRRLPAATVKDFLDSINQVMSRPAGQRKLPKGGRGNKTVSMRHAVVTPTRVYFTAVVEEDSSELLRIIEGLESQNTAGEPKYHSRLLRVAFRDEDMKHRADSHTIEVGSLRPSDSIDTFIHRLAFVTFISSFIQAVNECVDRIGGPQRNSTILFRNEKDVCWTNWSRVLLMT